MIRTREGSGGGVAVCQSALSASASHTTDLNFYAGIRGGALGLRTFRKIDFVFETRGLKPVAQVEQSGKKNVKKLQKNQNT